MQRLALALLLILLPQAVCFAGGDDDRQRRFDRFFLEAMVQRQKGNDDAAFDLLQQCLKIKPEASETYFFLAQYYGAMKQENTALDYYKKAASLSPANETYMETLARAYMANQQYAEATEVFEQLYSANKKRQDLLETLFSLYRAQERYDEAIEVLDRLEAIDGKTERLAQQKSALYLQMDNTDAAIKEIKSLAEQYPYDLNYLRMYADMLRTNGDEGQAFSLYKQILTEEPDNSLAQMSLRSYYISQGDTAKADSLTLHILLNKATSTDDKVYLMRREIVQSETEGGDSTYVLSLFRRMLAQPQETADIAELCAAYMGLKKMPEDSVAAMLHKVLDISPDNAQARLQLVNMAWRRNDDAQVISLCSDARQYNPDVLAFYYFQGLAYYRNEDNDNALDTFKNGLGVINENSTPEIVSDFYSIMGDLFHQKGLERQAFEAYDSCLQWKPDNIGCLNNYAYFLCLKGEQLSKAEQMSYRTIKAEPENSTYLDTYAWVLFVQQRYAEARIYIDQAIQHEQEDLGAEPLAHAGDIYAMCGDMQQAVEFWRQALEIEPGNKLLAKKVKRKKYFKK